MTDTMGPPPPRKPSTVSVAVAEPSTSESASTASLSSDPASRNNQEEAQPNPRPSHCSENDIQSINSTDSDNCTTEGIEKNREPSKTNSAVPYMIPTWSGPPCHHFFLEVLKDGAIVNTFDVNEKDAYMFGRVDLCDFVLEHPTISRFHAVLQFKSNGDAYLYDLASTHGTFLNKRQVKKKVFVDLHVGDVIRFGHSTRLYIFQGPSELMLPEADLKSLRNSKRHLEMQDMEASLLRAKVEASRADGISWGMREDAAEEMEDDIDEITWQNYKGLLTEKQEKTREKVIKRLEKIAHMKKEINSIRVKDIAQGGLTQGQQTQIARNEQRISQIMEELENLEETLNDSIRESMGARAGKLPRGKRKRPLEDEEEHFSDDDDEFYDRTQKPLKQKSGENQSVETADSLLDKKDAIIKKMEDAEKFLMDKDEVKETNEVAEAGDVLDAYMSAVSSQLVLDKEEKLQKELSALKSELDRINYLLTIVDPTGESAKKRESIPQKQPDLIVTHTPISVSSYLPSSKKQILLTEDSPVESIQDKAIVDAPLNSGKKLEEPVPVSDNAMSSAPVYTVTKPQWLGAVVDKKREEFVSGPTNVEENDQFVDYKDRVTILKISDPSQEGTQIEDASPGLIIRKRKSAEKSKAKVKAEVKDFEPSVDSKLQAEDAVALLLKHSKGYHASDEEERLVTEDGRVQDQRRNAGIKTERVLDPERPSFLKQESDYTSWVPPEGQSGDGRTSLNDRFGY